MKRILCLIFLLIAPQLNGKTANGVLKVSARVEYSCGVDRAGTAACGNAPVNVLFPKNPASAPTMSVEW